MISHSSSSARVVLCILVICCAIFSITRGQAGIYFQQVDIANGVMNVRVVTRIQPGGTVVFENSVFSYRSKLKSTYGFSEAFRNIVTQIPFASNFVNHGNVHGGNAFSFIMQFPNSNVKNYVQAVGGSPWSFYWEGKAKLTAWAFPGAIVGWGSLNPQIGIKLTSVSGEKGMLACTEKDFMAVGKYPSYSEHIETNLKIYKNGIPIYDGDLYARNQGTSLPYWCDFENKNTFYSISKKYRAEENQEVSPCWGGEEFCPTYVTTLGNIRFKNCSEGDATCESLWDKRESQPLFSWYTPHLTDEENHGPFLIKDTILLEAISFGENEDYIPFNRKVMLDYAKTIMTHMNQYQRYQYVKPLQNFTAPESGVVVALISKTGDKAGWDLVPGFNDECNDYVLVTKNVAKGESFTPVIPLNQVFFYDLRHDHVKFVLLPIDKHARAFQDSPVPEPCRYDAVRKVMGENTMRELGQWCKNKPELHCVDYFGQKFEDVVSVMFKNKCSCQKQPNYCRAKNVDDDEKDGVIVTFPIELGIKRASDVYQCEINGLKSLEENVLTLTGTSMDDYCKQTPPKPRLSLTVDGQVKISCERDNWGVVCGLNKHLIGIVRGTRPFIIGEHGFTINPYRLAVTSGEVACIDKATKKVESSATVKSLMNHIFKEEWKETRVYYTDANGEPCKPHSTNCQVSCALIESDSSGKYDFKGFGAAFTYQDLLKKNEIYGDDFLMVPSRIDRSELVENNFFRHSITIPGFDKTPALTPMHCLIRAEADYNQEDETETDHDKIFTFKTINHFGCGIVDAREELPSDYISFMRMHPIYTDREENVLTNETMRVPFTSRSDVLINSTYDSSIISDFNARFPQNKGFVFSCDRSAQKVIKFNYAHSSLPIKHRNFEKAHHWYKMKGDDPYKIGVVTSPTTNPVAEVTTPVPESKPDPCSHTKTHMHYVPYHKVPHLLFGDLLIVISLNTAIFVGSFVALGLIVTAVYKLVRRYN
ncbi:hypothetical protein AbHV_ORF35 [Abalone herpesvirus Victoria/AUS/2009]|uniref:Uncharacterized protein n=2 Tax=Aurivirus haliotidmalaco1 TaxID=3050290 RepID=K4JX37_ABHV|nr:hypothetical protein AbHV_ORF35 [Abalone herpesvirus Victoria/AUS/2009]ADL16655.1 AbHVp009c [Abalone herpesvirus Victoria/AUS/2007]AFU90045.1 hypothetical protein AbHV_ORF35 [Abalone herpesvirus Victoria/AUS/2009]